MSQHPLILSLVDLKHFFKKHNERGTSLIQLKILFRNKTKEFQVLLNKFLVDTNINADEKLKISIESLGLLTEVGSLIPGDKGFLIPRMKYSAFENFLRSNLVSHYTYSNLARNYSSATILSDLLIDEIFHFDELPELPSYKDPERFNRVFGPIFNILLSTTSVYQALITGLPVMSSEDFTEWSLKSLKMLNLFISLIDKFNIIELLKTKRVDDVMKLFANTLTMANSFSNFIILLKILFQTFGGDIPDEVDRLNLLKKSGITSVIEFIEVVENHNQSIILDIETAENQLLISKNDDIKDTIYYDFFLQNQDQIDITKQEFEMIAKGIFGNPEELDKVISGLHNILNSYVERAGSIDELFETAFINQFYEDLKNLIPYIALKSVEKGDITIYNKFVKKWGKIVNSSAYERDNELGYIILITKLYCFTRLQEKMNYTSIYDEIENALPHVVLRPRIFVCLSLLKLIIGMYIGRPISLGDEIVQQLYEIGVPEIESWYKDDVITYIEYLKNPITKGEMFERRSNYIPLDSFSWLIPEFENHPTSTGKIITFLPFNRYKDRVI